MYLRKYGFVLAGHWITKKTNYSGITFKLKQLSSERVIYAFVVGSKVKYIGICEKDTRNLNNRMGGYRSYQGNSTNRRIANKIKRELQSKRKVKIYALRPATTIEFKNIKIDLVKGLENPLIKKFCRGQLWNA